MKKIKTFLSLIIIIGLCGCSIKKEKDINPVEFKQIVLTEAQEKNAKLETDTLKDMDIELEIMIPAQFKAQNQAVDRIYSPIDGKVTEVFVEPGTIIKTGQPLAKIKSDAISQIQLEFLEKVLNMDSNIKQMQAQCELSSQNYRRENILVKEKISSRAEYDVANAEMRKDRANHNALQLQKSTLINVYQQRLAVYGAGEGTINQVLRTKKISPYITLSANKNGILLERKINPGEIVEKDKELFNLANLSTIWLVGYAFEKDSPALHIGQNVRGTLEEEKGKTINGVISYVSPILDKETKTLEVRADIANKDFTIKPNMYAEMYVKTGKVKRLAIPNNAVENYGDYHFAYVKIKPHTYEERKIDIGKNNEKYTEVISGLKEGEQVVTNGAFQLLGESIKQQEAN